jgi:hypothetical protein
MYDWSNRVVVCKCEWFIVVRVCIVSRASEERTRLVWYVVHVYQVCMECAMTKYRYLPGCQGAFSTKKQKHLPVIDQSDTMVDIYSKLYEGK